MRRFLLAATAAWCLTAAPALAAGDVSGTYSIKGWNPGKPTSGAPSYVGSLTLTPAGGFIKARWTVGAAKAVNEGVGMVKDVGGQRLLSLSYIEAGHPAVAIYKVSADGKKLEGEWGSVQVGHETATR